MGKKSISRNYFYNMLYEILALILPIITTPYLARTLGAESIGIYSYTLSIATYFILFGTLGIALYGQREIAYVQDNKKKRSLIFWEVFLLKVCTMLISTMIYFVSFCLNGQYRIYFTILLIELLTQTLDIIWFFRGIEEFKKTAIRNLIVKILFVICIFIFVKNSGDLVKYIFIVTLANLFGNVTLWLYLPKFINKIKIKELNLKKHLKPVIMLFIPQIAVQIYNILDKTMIGYIVDNKSEVGFYEQTTKITSILTTFVTSLGLVMVPRMASTFAKGDKEQLKKYMYNSFRFVFFLALPVVAGVIIVSDRFVPVFFGEGYDSIKTLIKILSPIILFIGMTNILGTQYLLPVKKQKEYTISVIIGAIINFSLNLIFIPKMLSVGASITTIIAEVSVLIVQAFFIRKEFKFFEIMKLSLKNLIATLIMIIGIIWINFIDINIYIALAVQISLGIFIYGITLLVLKDEFIKMILEKFKDKLKILSVVYRLVWKEG